MSSRVEWVGRYRRAGGTFAIFVPLELRRLMGWQNGDYLIVVRHDGLLMIRKVDKSMIAGREHGPAGDGGAHVS